MNCPRCGAPLAAGDPACTICASPVVQPPPPAHVPPGYAPLPIPSTPAQPAWGATYPPPQPPSGAPRIMSGFPPPPEPQASPSRRMLAGFLVSFQDEPLGRYWAVWQGRNTVGRADTGQPVDIPIAHGTTSTHHATIDCEGDRWTLTDLGSTNGTFHNEQPVGFQGKRELRHGDQIRFGGFSTLAMIITAATG